jgi:hypothetical protein
MARFGQRPGTSRLTATIFDPFNALSEARSFCGGSTVEIFCGQRPLPPRQHTVLFVSALSHLMLLEE